MTSKDYEVVKTYKGIASIISEMRKAYENAVAQIKTACDTGCFNNVDMVGCVNLAIAWGDVAMLSARELIRHKGFCHNAWLEARRINRQIDEWNDGATDWKSFGDYEYDHRYVKYEVKGVMTEAEIKEFIDDAWVDWYNPWDDGRDCTGVWFTTSIRCIPIAEMNKTIIIHIQSCDV